MLAAVMVAASRLAERTYQWDGRSSWTPGTDGLAYLRAVVAGTLPLPPAAATLGFGLVRADHGLVVLSIMPEAYHNNPAGVMLGGICAAVCDAACACAVLTMLPAGAVHATQSLTTSFVRPVTTQTGQLCCTASVLHLGRRTGLAEAQLADPGGRLIVQATSTFVITEG